MAEETVEFPYTAGYNPELDPYLHAIGRLSWAWSIFEFTINEAIWELANVSRHAGTCMTSQLIGPGPRFRCLVALLNLREVPQNLINEINTLTSTAEKLGRQRNRYLHDPIVMHMANKTVHRMETTADRTLKHDIVPVDIDEIKKLVKDIDEIEIKFEHLYDRVRADTPPWPSTEYEQSRGIRRERHPLPPSSSPAKSEPPPESSAE
jgi:hypothetical protein